MFNIITANSGSFEFNDFEKRIIKKLLNYAQHNLKNGNGSYLATIDLDKIHFTWCPKMSVYTDINNKNSLRN